jgi:hypothetical protein
MLLSIPRVLASMRTRVRSFVVRADLIHGERPGPVPRYALRMSVGSRDVFFAGNRPGTVTLSPERGYDFAGTQFDAENRA